jgi:transposase
MNITTIGVDLAKEVITVCTMDRSGHVLQSRNLRSADFAAWLVQLPAATVVGMEACSSAHHWARKMQSMGLIPKLMAAEFVQPFRKSRSAKNDQNDAEAIAIAVRQPQMRFVAIKTEAQQARLAWHRLREGWKEERTALINRTRGLLLEFGYPLARSSKAFAAGLQAALHHSAFAGEFRSLLARAQEHLKQLDEQLAQCERTIGQSAKQDAHSKRLQAQPGIGPISADALSASVGDARDFRNGRQFAAWLGLTPRQYSSGGKTKLGRISRRGDAYLRTLLVQGAKSTLQSAIKKAPHLASRMQQWILTLYGRVGYHKTLIAIANKHARQVWAMLAKGEEYDEKAWERMNERMNKQVTAT